MQAASRPWRILLFLAVPMAVIAATGYAVYIIQQAQATQDSVDFVSQKEYRNFARAPARWERMTRQVLALEHSPDSLDAIDEAFTAIDVIKLRIHLLKSLNYDKYAAYLASNETQAAVLPVPVMMARLDRIAELTSAIESHIIDIEAGEAFSLERLSPSLEEGAMLLQTLEAGMADYTLHTLDEQVQKIDRFFTLNFHLFLVFAATLLGMSAFATYSRFQQSRLNEALAREAEASAAKDRFLANISHELRTPLNAILGTTHLALDDPDSQTLQQREQLQQVQRSANLLLELVNDVLQLAKIRSDSVQLKDEVTDLNALIQDVDHTAVSLLQPGTRFTVDNRLPKTFFVRCDAVRLQQVLNNLVSNACKFTHEGEIRLQVESEDQPDGTAHITVAVIDDGIGIPHDRQARLFQPFSQVSPERDRQYGGTGLGLSISQSIIEAMGGRISVCSAAGEGSTFSFSIYLKREDAPQLAPVKPHQSYDLAGLRILLVEDNPINLKIASTLLQKQGAEVFIARDGIDAEEQVVTIGPDRLDMILMDIEMPRRDGHATTIALRQRFGSLLPQIVALTAHAFDGERSRALAAGMQGFITKPIKPDILYHAVMTHARR